MINALRFFGNPLENKEISAIRLANCAKDAVIRMERSNVNGENTELINSVSPKQDALRKEVDDVDQTLAGQKGKTVGVDQVMEKFKVTMSDKEGVIADLFGGFKSEGYLAFYPRGVSEYTTVNKTNITTLLNRVNNACLKYQPQMSNSLFSTLQPFEAMWNSARAEQEMLKSDVSINRNERSTARKALEKALLAAMHTIAARYPGDTEKCMTYFDFSLLYPAGTRSKSDDETPDTTTNAATSAEEQEVME